MSVCDLCDIYIHIHIYMHLCVGTVNPGNSNPVKPRVHQLITGRPWANVTVLLLQYFIIWGPSFKFAKGHT